MEMQRWIMTISRVFRAWSGELMVFRAWSESQQSIWEWSGESTETEGKAYRIGLPVEALCGGQSFWQFGLL